MDWEQILSLAEENRPDVIELKLILEADQQLLYQARNSALPRTDAVALYRWNGLEGEMPIGTNLSSAPGQFTDWTLAVNFSVPLGLRQSRAGLATPRVGHVARPGQSRPGLAQRGPSTGADAAQSGAVLRTILGQHRTASDAAETNLNLQLSEYRGGRQNFLVVLLAITDWGNAVSAQAQTLLQYNTELANLERRTGTILETHGVRFYEERFGAISPLGRLLHGAFYPQSLPPTMNFDRYPGGTEPGGTDIQSLGSRAEVASRAPPTEELPRPKPPTPATPGPQCTGPTRRVDSAARSDPLRITIVIVPWS